MATALNSSRIDLACENVPKVELERFVRSGGRRVATLWLGILRRRIGSRNSGVRIEFIENRLSQIVLSILEIPTKPHGTSYIYTH